MKWSTECTHVWLCYGLHLPFSYLHCDQRVGVFLLYYINIIDVSSSLGQTVIDQLQIFTIIL